MIVFGAFTPHTPLLLESIGKEHTAKLGATRAALVKVSERMKAARVETLVMFSAHSGRREEAFTVNLYDPYGVDLSAFGDVTTQKTFHPDVELIDRLQRALRRAQHPMALCSSPALDYGTAVPLLVLFRDHGHAPRLVPFSYSGASAVDHFAFGQALFDVLAHSKKRIAVLASGDLSHALSSNAPLGLRAEGKRFDTAVVNALRRADAETLLALDPAVLEASGECAYRPLLMLLGTLSSLNLSPKVLSYEAPFGVGFATAEFIVK